MKDHYERQYRNTLTALPASTVTHLRRKLCVLRQTLTGSSIKQLVRRLNVASHVLPEADARRRMTACPADLFTDYEALEVKQEQERAELERERKCGKPC